MKKHTIERKERSLSENNNISLDYSLILTDGKKYDLFDERNVYSILILQIEDGITTEYDFLYDVARDEKSAVAILDMLVYNNVMPANAREVLADQI